MGTSTALTCAVLVVISAHTAQAGINVWTSQGPQFLQTPETVSVLSIDPATPRTLYAGTSNDGVFKSTNAGETWSATGLYNTSANALAIDPTTPTALYAGTSGGVFSIQQIAKAVGTGTAASCTDAALDAALAGGGLVTFNCGPASVTIDISPGAGGTGRKTIAADTTIDGGSLITISGGNSVGVFSVNTGVKFTVQNLTIANANNAGNGGAIYTYGGTLAVTNSTFTNNRANSGGGIGTSDTLTVTNSAFIGNRADGGSGGAISNSGGALVVTNSTFTNNSADTIDGELGGGIFNSGALTVTNSTFTGNRAGGGGGIGSVKETLTVTHSTFTSNSSGAGGGIACSGGSVSNSTFTGNNSTELGGGIYTGGALTVTNSTFTGNSGADGGGGGNIYGDRGAPVLLRNTVVANNSAGDNCSGTITDGGHNLDDGTSCGFSAANASLSNTNPQLDPAGLQNNGGPTQTVALCTAVGVPAACTAASPAIDAGDQAVCAAPPVNDLDQRGFVRPGSGHTQCSIGAYEADVTPLEACLGDCDASGSVTIDEILSLVNVALGAAQPSACAHGVPSGVEVNVALILQAVNAALNGCGG